MEVDTEMDHKECEGMFWIHLTQNSIHWQVPPVNTVINLWVLTSFAFKKNCHLQYFSLFLEYAVFPRQKR
jgi:hypothetical protein